MSQLTRGALLPSLLALLLFPAPLLAQAGVVPQALQEAAESAAKNHAAQPAPARGSAAAAAAAKKKGKPGAVAPQPPATPPICQGDYASALPPEVASRVVDSKEQFIYAVRSTATYERVYYGRDGKLRKQYLRAVAHGTAFALRVVNGETLLVTNEHVASRPDVTDEEHTVDGIPPGAKKVREQLKIVRDESDDYEPGHLPLTKVLSDPAADLAVIKAKKILPVMPFRLGRSGALRAGNLAQVRGFPLGAFPALSQGKVINPYTEDTDKAWSHHDFVIDALLSSGNSGSPVFAISCHTGEPELVGVFHAGYTDATALNVVVAIDQLKEELETLKVVKRDLAGARLEITAADRDTLIEELLEAPAHQLIIPFGGRAVEVVLGEPTTLRFSILEEEYPLGLQETMALIDHSASGFGTLDAVSWLMDHESVEVPVGALDADTREHFERLYDGLWHQLLSVNDYRIRAARGRASADAFADAQAVRSRLKKKVNDQKELLGLCAYDADRAGVPASRPSVAAAAVAAPAAGAPPPAGAPFSPGALPTPSARAAPAPAAAPAGAATATATPPAAPASGGAPGATPPTGAPH